MTWARWALLVHVLFVALVLAMVGVARGGLARAAAAPPRVRHLALPEPRRAASGSDWSTFDAAPGEPASVEHPSGTVVVAEAGAFEPSPSVTEWDLERGSIVRSVPLPLTAAYRDLRIVRAGNVFHLVATDGPRGRIVYARLSRHLEVGGLETVGDGERPRIATDGDVVAVLWSGAREGASDGLGLQLRTFDASGAPLGGARLTPAGDAPFLLGGPLAVATGLTYAIVPASAAGAGSARVVVCGADARPLATLDVPWARDDGRLFTVGGRVYFTDGCRALDVTDAGALPVAAPVDLPDRAAQARTCPAFEAASDDAADRLVTTGGDVLDTTFHPLRRLARPEGAVLRALWLDGRAALLVAGGPGGRASLAWSAERER